jgi:diguanylate cyclase (GGDEF)-like protein
MSEVAGFLAGLPAFSGMEAGEVETVASFLSRRAFAPGARVFRENEAGSELFIVRAGRFASWVLHEDGERREVYEFLPGMLFGEMAIIENAPRMATCEAAEEGELLVLDGIDFYRLVWEHPVLAVKLLSAMARYMTSRLDEASGFLGDLVRWGESARRRSIGDDLSGLFNRRFLEEAITARFTRGSAASRRSSLVMLDIDRFREVNAAFGPLAGDSVIATLGAVIGGLVGEGEVAARLAGDEFAIFLPGAGPARARDMAERIRAEAEGLFLEFKSGAATRPERLRISVSLGTASAPEDAECPAALFQAADAALFQAKAGGRNRVASASPASPEGEG